MLYIINMDDDLILNYMNILEFMFLDFLGNFWDEGILSIFECVLMLRMYFKNYRFFFVDELFGIV